jgi:hypothetical protein
VITPTHSVAVEEKLCENRYERVFRKSFGESVDLLVKLRFLVPLIFQPGTDPAVGIDAPKESSFPQRQTKGSKQVVVDAVEVVAPKRFPGLTDVALDREGAFSVIA